MMPNDITQRLMSVRDAAKYLAISERTLWNLTNEKKIPAAKIGRCVRYDVKDIDRFINQAKGATL